MEINFRGVTFEVEQDGDGLDIIIYLEDKHGRFIADEFCLNMYLYHNSTITLYDALWDKYWEENKEGYETAKRHEEWLVGV